MGQPLLTGKTIGTTKLRTNISESLPTTRHVYLHTLVELGKYASCSMLGARMRIGSKTSPLSSPRGSRAFHSEKGFPWFHVFTVSHLCHAVTKYRFKDAVKEELQRQPRQIREMGYLAFFKKQLRDDPKFKQIVVDAVFEWEAKRRQGVKRVKHRRELYVRVGLVV